MSPSTALETTVTITFQRTLTFRKNPSHLSTPFLDENISKDVQKYARAILRKKIDFA